MIPGADVVRDAIAAAVPGWLGTGFGLAPRSFSIAGRAWSYEIRFRAEGPAGAAVACIGKIPRWEEASALEDVLAAGPQAAVAVEFDTLGEIAAMIAAVDDPGLAAVEPIGMLPERNLIVTRVLEALPLRRHSRRPHRRAGRIEPVLRRTGRWLRRFHDEVGGARRAAAPPEELGVPVPEGGPAVEGFFELAGEVRARLGRIEKVVVGDLHGDVNTNNVLVTPTGAVAFVDPNRRRGIVLDDVAHLAAELRAGRVRALSQGRIPGRRVTEDRIGALTAGYGSPDPAILEPLVARDLLVRWRAAEDRLQRRGAAPMRRSVRRHVRREIESALAGS